MKNFIFGILIIAGMVLMFVVDAPRQKAINKYNCAVYGYEEDCRTPLPVGSRLK